MQTLTAPPSQHLALPGSLAAPTLSSACLRPSVLQGCLLSLLEPPLIHLADNVLCSCELGEWSTGIRGQALISPSLSFLTFKMGILVLLPDLVGR